MSNKHLTVDARIWIEGKNATFMGEGRYSLLLNIMETGSINEACKRMNMSYKKALKLIDAMNSQTENPLVVSISGGKGGGGTEVTTAGKRAMKMYSELCDLNKNYLNAAFNKLKDEF